MKFSKATVRLPKYQQESNLDPSLKISRAKALVKFPGCRAAGREERKNGRVEGWEAPFQSSILPIFQSSRLLRSLAQVSEQQIVPGRFMDAAQQDAVNRLAEKTAFLESKCVELRVEV